MSDGQPSPGDIFIGRFRIERVLGAGTMGLVLSATHIELEQRVAIKLMLPGRAPAEQHQRFLREARISAKLTSPHVAKVIDVGTSEHGAPYMIMEYLAGRDLAAELTARGPLPFEEAVGYVLEACEAVAEAHAAGVVHRDIKPANMFLAATAKGGKLVKVLDFGVSKTKNSLALTNESAAMGSPLYMAPEQMENAREVDGRADVWALAITLYELCAGKTPFHAERIEELCAKVYFKPPAPLSTYRTDAPEGFEGVLMRSFEKEREKRWPDVAAFAAALVPYGPPGAADAAKRVAENLGAQAAAPLVEGAAVRSAASAPAAAETGEAVVKPATVTPRPRVIAGVVAAIAVIGVALLGVARWRSVLGAPHAAGAGSVTADPEVPAAHPGLQPDAAASPPPPPSATTDAGAPSITVAPAPCAKPAAKPVPQTFAPPAPAPLPHAPTPAPAKSEDRYDRGN